MYISKILVLILVFSHILCQQEMQTLTLNAAMRTGSLVMGDQYMFVGMDDATPVIHRVCINNMTKCGTVTGLDTRSNRLIWGAADRTNKYMYFGSMASNYLANNQGAITKIDYINMQEKAIEILIPGVDDYYPTTMELKTSLQKAYIVADRRDHAASTVNILDIAGDDITDFYFFPSTCITGPTFFYWTESIVLGNRLILFGHTGATTSTKILDINLVAAETKTCTITEHGPFAGITDITGVTTDSAEQFLFVTLGTAPQGKLLKLDITTFNILDTYLLQAGDGAPQFALISEDRYVWMASNTNPSYLYRINMNNFATGPARIAMTNARNIINGVYSTIGNPTIYLGSTDGRVSKVYVGVCKPGTRMPLPCVNCAPGTYSTTEGASTCEKCGRGYYSTEIGANSSATCQRCPPGRVSNVLGSNSISNCTVCGPGEYANLTTCLKCPVGYFHNDPIGYNISTCKPCATGSYSDVPGSNTCTKCIKGTYSITPFGNNSNVCIQCPRGTYSEIDGANTVGTCTLCPQGRVSNVLGSQTQTDCTLCGIGTFANLTVCRDCPMGTYQNLTGRWTQVQCVQCPPGSYQGVPRSATCNPCAAGRYSTAIGATSVAVCQQCPAGTYSANTGAGSAATCQNCPPGTVSTTIGATTSGVCSSCAIGKYAAVTVCVDCPLGTFGNISNAANYTDCHDCGAGRFQDIPGMSSCKLCPAGTYSSSPRATGVSACLSCGAGYYNDFGPGATSNAVCKACPIGTWSNLPSADSLSRCTACPAGTYSNTVAAQSFVACITCVAGTYNMIPGASNASMCIPCLPGYRSTVVGATTNNTCTMCPSGTYSGAPGSVVCTNCQPTSYCPPGSSFEMPSTPFKQQTVNIIDPHYEEEFRSAGLWYIRLIVLFTSMFALCVLSFICCCLVCCYYKNPIDICSYFDCFFARLHYHRNKEPITRSQNIFGGACTCVACYLILILFVAIFSSFFSANIVTEASYIGTGLDDAELVGDPKYTRGRYRVEMLLYGVFTGSSCNPVTKGSSTFSYAHTALVSASTRPMLGGTGCTVIWDCQNCEITGVKNRVTFNFPAGSFATGIEFETSFPSLYSEGGEFTIEGNMNADSGHILSGSNNPSVIHYVVHKSEYREKTIFSTFLDYFNNEFGQSTSYGLTGAWEDVTIGDQIRSGTGVLVSTGLSVAVDFRLAPEKYVIEDVISEGLLLFFAKLAGVVIVVLAVLGCCMRCCECVWFRGIVGRKSKFLVMRGKEGDYKQQRYDTLLNSSNMMKTARDDDLQIDDDDLDLAEPPRELVESIVDVDWHEGLNSVELAVDDDDDTPFDGPTPGEFQGIDESTVKGMEDFDDVLELDIGNLDGM